MTILFRLRKLHIEHLWTYLEPVEVFRHLSRNRDLCFKSSVIPRAIPAPPDWWAPDGRVDSANQQRRESVSGQKPLLGNATTSRKPKTAGDQTGMRSPASTAKSKRQSLIWGQRWQTVSTSWLFTPWLTFNPGHQNPLDHARPLLAPHSRAGGTCVLAMPYTEKETSLEQTLCERKFIFKHNFSPQRPI